MKTIHQQFSEIKLLPLFEIEVIDKRTNEQEYIIFKFNIEEDKKAFFVYHVALNEEQEESDKVPHFFRLIEQDETLDYLLQELYKDCISLIIDSEFYKLT